MAEGDGYIYNNFKEQVMEGEFNLASGGDALNLALASAYTPDIDAHIAFPPATLVEEAGAGYVAGGEVLAGQDVTQDDANDRGVFDATDVTWTGLDVGTPSHAVLYDEGHASDLLICYWELGTTPSNGGDYTLQFHANGIITLT